MAPLYGERLPIEKRRVSSMLSTKRRWRIPMSGFGRCRPDGFPNALIVKWTVTRAERQTAALLPFKSPSADS
jgi:hypothetical protein